MGNSLSCIFRQQIYATYSVFEIDNSNRILDNIVTDIKNRFEKCFTQQDSVMVFKLSASCEVLRFGYAKNDENDFFIIT